MDLSTHVVYAMTLDTTSFVKIGISTIKSLYSRYKALSTHSPYDVKVIGIQKCESLKEAKHVERELLDRFDRVNPKKEWVRNTYEVRTYIEEQMDKGQRYLDESHKAAKTKSRSRARRK